MKKIKLLLKLILLFPSISLKGSKSFKRLTFKKKGVNFRPDTGDVGAIFDVFFKKNYHIKDEYFRKQLETNYKKILNEGNSPLIYDFGAHIGGASRYFLENYPKSQIIAVEPSSGTFDMLKYNLEGFESIELRNEGIFDKTLSSGEIFLAKDSWGDNAFVKNTNNPTSVKIPNFLGEFMTKNTTESDLFICKVDIEGAEKFLFDQELWSILDQFTCVMIEFHDWLLPRDGTSNNAMKWISSKKRCVLVKNEMVYIFKDSL